jgi:hypothetical protein
MKAYILTLRNINPAKRVARVLYVNRHYLWMIQEQQLLVSSVPELFVASNMSLYTVVM